MIDSEKCPKMSAMPDGNGRWCAVRHVPLPAGPCPANCEHRPEVDA